MTSERGAAPGKPGAASQASRHRTPAARNGSGVARSTGADVVYPYVDEDGVLLYEAVRKPDKEFRCRRPDPKGGYLWELGYVRRVPYRLPELLAAAERGGSAFVVEGEKDADRLAGLGLVATTNLGGCNWSWPEDWAGFFQGFGTVYVLADNDDPGRVAARKRAELIATVVHDVRLVDQLPGVDEHGDVSDYLDAGHGLDELWKVAEAGVAVHAPEPEPQAAQASIDLRGARELLALAEDIDLFHTPDGESYARVPVGGRSEVLSLGDKSFNNWLRQRYFEKTGKPAQKQSLADAVATLDARAVHEGPELNVGLRTAMSDGAVVIDLCNEQRQVVVVTAEGRRVVDEAPVPFRRPKSAQALPVPESGGGMDELRRFVNVDDKDWPLLLAYITFALVPGGPYPVLCLCGEQGSAKSTTARVVRRLVDPAMPDLRAMPRDLRDLAIGARNAHLLCFDNLSYLKADQSDALCRLSTGGGLATRKLWTDTDEQLFDSCRPVALTGIVDVAERSDLIDRSLVMRCPTIADNNRRDERAFWAEFEQAWPCIFGALLDAVSDGLANRDTVFLPRTPRMADFARFAVAAEPGLELPPGSFLAAYEENRAEANALALEGSLLWRPIETLADEGGYEGDMSSLLTELVRLAAIPGADVTKGHGWPKSPKALRGELSRMAPNLREAGIDVRFPGRVAGGRSGVVIERRHVPKEGEQPSLPSLPSLRAGDQDEWQ